MGAAVIDLAQALADDLDEYTTGLDCELSRIYVTFGEPPDPTTDNCKQIAVWVNNVSPRPTEPQSCTTLALVTLGYRIFSCYPIQAQDLTDDQHLDAADCIYEIAEAVWCGLVRGKDTGDLMGVGDCKRIVLGPLVSDLPRGGISSMTGTVTTDYECAHIPQS